MSQEGIREGGGEGRVLGVGCNNVICPLYDVMCSFSVGEGCFVFECILVSISMKRLQMN